MARKMHLNISREIFVELFVLEKKDVCKVEITCRGSSGINRVRVIRMLCRPGLLPGDVRLI